MCRLFSALVLFAFVRVYAQDSAPVYVFSTLAGRAGTTGSSDGAGRDARFNGPTGIAVDRTGTIYVSDVANGTIRKISPAGVVSTLAGRAQSFGSANGLGSTARFGRLVPPVVPGLAIPINEDNVLGFPNCQNGITVDVDGVVYVADTANAAIRRISTEGLVTTFATVETASSPGELGEAARLVLPTAVAMNAAGNLLIAEFGNRMVRQATPQGVVTTLAGAPETRNVASPIPGAPPSAVAVDAVDGVGIAARFSGPTGIASGRGGEIYTADASAIRKIAANGTVSTIAGTLASPPPFTLNIPGLFAGMVVDGDGSILVCQPGTHRILRVSPSGTTTPIAGSASGEADGVGTQASFRGPKGIAIDADGNLYIADTINQTIRKGLRVVAPIVQSQPVSRTIIPGESIVFSVTASSSAALTYQWRRNGTAITGATNAVLTLASPTDRDAGDYSVAITNVAGTALSATATLTVILAPVVQTPPTITTQPRAQSLLGGQALTLTVGATGTGSLTYQWQRDGVDLAGATSATLSVASADAADAGRYTVDVRGAGGVVRSAVAIVEVNTSRIVNLSIRSTLTTVAPVLTVGFVASGGTKSLLIRGAGPGLAQFGVGGVLADPRLALYAGTSVVANNDNWGSAANASDVTANALRLGAFALPAGSLDAALLTDVGAAGYSVQITGGANASGIVLVELYDANPTTLSRLVNVSARSFVGTADSVLVAGFVVSGNSPRTLLIRAIGPTLAAFGVGGVLADPKIEIFTGGVVAPIAGNDNWGVTPALAATYAALGAFPLSAVDSKDAALLVTLPPGSYTAQVSGVGNATGEALVEIYEVP